MDRRLERPSEDHQLAESAAFRLCFMTQDYNEGITSFLEKREPNWVGR